MQLEILRSNQRGDADHGWLRSKHSFSFADYYDPRRMGFGHLRVINEDRVDGGMGFPTHPHRNMEILSYVIDGALAHEDTSGGGGVLRHGDVQVMSAGRGVAHSEFNADRTEPVHFLQIWLLPKEGGTAPRYDQKHYALDQRGPVLVASPDGRDGSLQIGQDTDIWRLLLTAGEGIAQPIQRGRAWVQVVSGTLTVNGAVLQTGDGLAVVDATSLDILPSEDTEALLFDLV